MTKLKNTKKGMAKKALSISLVAAMLATSNVPVWAAEDLFTDGSSAAVEAPVVEEPAAEVEAFSAEPAEVVEDTAPTVDLQAAETTGTGYEVSGFKFSDNVKDNKIVWGIDGGNGNTVTASFNIKGAVPNNQKVYYAWRVDGVAENNNEIVPTADGVNLNESITLSAENADHTLQFYMYAVDTKNNNSTIWTYASDVISVESIDNSEAMKANITIDSTFNPTYDGEEHKITLDNLNFGDADKANYEIDSISGDLVNVTDGGVNVVVKDIRDGYKGTVTLNYKITPMTLDGTKNMISDHFVATLNTKNFVYTGKVIRVKAADVKVVDKDTNADLSNYLKADKDGYVSLAKTSVQKVGKTTFKLNLETPETGNKNYIIEPTTSASDADGYRTVTTDEATVTARDLSTVNVEVTAQTIPSNGTLTLAKDAFKFTDAQGAELDLFDDLETVTIKEVNGAGTYKATLEPKTNNKNVTGKKDITVTVVEASIAGAYFAGSEATTSEEYTGEAVTKTEEQLGQLLDSKGQGIDKSLYEVTYKDNVDEGTASIIVKGKGSFAGSEAVAATFKINPAEVKDDTITKNDRVEYKDTTDPEDYAEEFGIVVKAKNADGKEFTLVEGTDYKVEYEFIDVDGSDKNKKGGDNVGDKVKATITITNKNFIKNNAKTFIKETTIDYKAITSENIKLRQTAFTYTGKAIEPEFDIVIDGKVINPDFFEASFVNNTEAGTATLTVKGDGKNYSTESASVTFTINPADINSLEGVIASKEYTGYSITLAEEDFNLTLNKDRINVKDNFTLTYGTNVEIGEGTVTLTPKNGNFTGSRTFTFQITGEMLNGSGTWEFYDENGIKVQNPSFTYDGTAKEYAKTVFTYIGGDVDADKLVEGVDYEIKYVDNIYGKDINYDANTKGQNIAVLAIAKGKYGSNFTNPYGLENGVYTDADGNKIANVIAVKYIPLEQLKISESNVSVSNGTYAAGLSVKPNVDIVVNGVVLKEGQDYELDLSANKDLTNVTASKSLTVVIKGKNGYTGTHRFNWGIDKFNLANAEVSVDGDAVTVKCGRVDIETSEYTVTREGSTLTVTAVEGSKNYTGSKTINVETEDEKPATPEIQSVNVNGNNATVVLSGEADGATGYDYVISTDRNCITNKDYDKVNKNILSTETTFTYTQQGVYYAYVHAWKRVDGVKVFSDWSEAYPFSVTAITPEQPVITSVKKSGRNLTVTWTQSANATTGYDIVMGTELRKVNGEIRPVEYGKAVKKLGPNTYSVTFRSIPKGTYYVALHAHNRTSETGVKVFSPWSNYKKVTF